MVSRAKIVSPLPNADLSVLLVVSIDHICTSTAQLLEAEAHGKSNTIMLTIAPWGDYGWFMWVPNEPSVAGDPSVSEDEQIPADLYHIFVYAHHTGADYLLIDIDAAVNPDLPVYPEN